MYFTKNDIDTRRARLTAAWDALLKADETVLIYSGEPIQKPGGLDQTYPFLPHPSYYWITGRRRESEVLLYNKEIGWLEFHKHISDEEIYWDGERHDILVASEGKNITELDDFLKQNRFSKLFRLGQTPTDPDAVELRTAMDKTRRKKDRAEIELIRKISVIAQHGYHKIAEILKPGLSEKEIGIAYEAEIFRQGSHTVPYDSIVGSGGNAAILHALPSQKIIRPDEFVLIDAGADVFDYCVDITRTFYSSGEMKGRHKDLYAVVQRAHAECMAMCRAGVQWKDVHGHAARVVTEGLRDLGILKGNPDDLIEKEVAFLFLPHGVGHLVGLRVRDTGQEENVNPKRYFGARLRVDLELEEDHLVTVEPGCYFMPSILDKPEVRNEFDAFINRAELDKWRDIGGVRIEDNLLIRKDGYENLTINVPKITV